VNSIARSKKKKQWEEGPYEDIGATGLHLITSYTQLSEKAIYWNKRKEAAIPLKRGEDV